LASSFPSVSLTRRLADARLKVDVAARAVTRVLLRGGGRREGFRPRNGRQISRSTERGDARANVNVIREKRERKKETGSLKRRQVGSFRKLHHAFPIVLTYACTVLSVSLGEFSFRLYTRAYSHVAFGYSFPPFSGIHQGSSRSNRIDGGREMIAKLE